MMSCVCPRIDNGRGKGILGGAVTTLDGRPCYWISEDCPLHGAKEKPDA